MPSTKPRVEIAPMTARDWAVTLWTLAGVFAFYGGLVVVQAGVFGQGWSGALFVLAGVCAVGGVLLSVSGKRL